MQGGGAVDEERDEGEGRREPAPNPTQQRIDDEADTEAPADASWDERDWGGTPTDEAS